jgi:hypothetical protein
MSERECNPCECPDCRADTSRALRLEADLAALEAERDRLREAAQLALESLTSDGGIAPAVVALRWVLNKET